MYMLRTMNMYIGDTCEPFAGCDPDVMTT